MTLLPNNHEINCFIPCDETKIESGLCSCSNRLKNKTINKNSFDLSILINQYFDENLIGKFTDDDSEFIKEILRDFIENYYK